MKKSIEFFNKQEVLSKIKGKLIVSCQALKTEPLYGSDTMAKLANAAELGGAGGIRANYVQDIKAIMNTVNLPVLGIIKRDYDNSDCYITPTIKEVDELIEGVNPHIIAVDATNRKHPEDENGVELIKKIKEKYPNVILMADISTYEEGLEAQNAGVDIVSTTLSGYTPYSPKNNGPDFELMQKLAQKLTIPVIGEGKVWTPEEAKKAFDTGIFALVVGTAITRPKEITQRFVTAINDRQ